MLGKTSEMTDPTTRLPLAAGGDSRSLSTWVHSTRGALVCVLVFLLVLLAMYLYAVYLRRRR
jgi:hypothetical protein